MEMKTNSFPCCFPVVFLYSVFGPDRPGYTVHQLALTCTMLDKLTSGNIPSLYEMEKLNRDCTPSERDTNRLFIRFRL